MEIKKVVLVGDNRDEGYRLLVNGVEIAHTNYEEHGSAGIYLLGQVHDSLAKLAGVYPLRESEGEQEELATPRVLREQDCCIAFHSEDDDTYVASVVCDTPEGAEEVVEWLMAQS